MPLTTRRSLSYAAVGGLLVSAGVVAPTVVAPAQAQDGESEGAHCVLQSEGRTEYEQVVGEVTCVDTFAESAALLGYDDVETPAELVEAAAALSSDVAVHFDGLNYTGDTLTVSGACDGGWINMSSAWNNRISSTLSSCGRVRHFLDLDLGGSYYDTTGSGNLPSGFSNAISSVKYLAS